MAAYYNEFDRSAAAWLRELIKQGLIAPGEVDERSIEDVTPNELRDFTQCHFFAGIGVWSYALRQAGWPDDRPVWTGSCPCQPFSSAGKGKGTADERHLWPAFHWLIDQCLPDVVFGEQVAKKGGLTWLDLVSTDLEFSGYSCGAAVTAACGFGAPHIRQRLYWVADSSVCGGRTQHGEPDSSLRQEIKAGGHDILGGVADHHQGLEKRERDGGVQSETLGSYTGETVVSGGDVIGLANPHQSGWQRERGSGFEESDRITQRGEASRLGDPNLSERGTREPKFGRDETGSGGFAQPGLPNFWRDADWIWCQDEKYRPAKSGIFPLVDGSPGRVGLLRGYGNALVGPQAQAFIEAYLEAGVV